MTKVKKSSKKLAKNLQNVWQNGTIPFSEIAEMKQQIDVLLREKELAQKSIQALEISLNNTVQKYLEQWTKDQQKALEKHTKEVFKNSATRICSPQITVESLASFFRIFQAKDVDFDTLNFEVAKHLCAVIEQKTVPKNTNQETPAPNPKEQIKCFVSLSNLQVLLESGLQGYSNAVLAVQLVKNVANDICKDLGYYLDFSVFVGKMEQSLGNYSNTYQIVRELVTSAYLFFVSELTKVGKGIATTIPTSLECQKNMFGLFDFFKQKLSSLPMDTNTTELLEKGIGYFFDSYEKAFYPNYPIVNNIAPEKAKEFVEMFVQNAEKQPNEQRNVVVTIEKVVGIETANITDKKDLESLEKKVIDSLVHLVNNIENIIGIDTPNEIKPAEDKN